MNTFSVQIVNEQTREVTTVGSQIPEDQMRRAMNTLGAVAPFVRGARQIMDAARAVGEAQEHLSQSIEGLFPSRPAPQRKRSRGRK